jgi:hypothetical protein
MLEPHLERGRRRIRRDPGSSVTGLERGTQLRTSLRTHALRIPRGTIPSHPGPGTNPATGTHPGDRDKPYRQPDRLGRGLGQRSSDASRSRALISARACTTSARNRALFQCDGPTARPARRARRFDPGPASVGPEHLDHAESVAVVCEREDAQRTGRSYPGPGAERGACDWYTFLRLLDLSRPNASGRPSRAITRIRPESSGTEDADRGRVSPGPGPDPLRARRRGTAVQTIAAQRLIWALVPTFRGVVGVPLSGSPCVKRKDQFGTRCVFLSTGYGDSVHNVPGTANPWTCKRLQGGQRFT